MTKRNANPPPSVSSSVLSSAASHKPSMSLLGTDSEDEDMELLPSRRGGRGRGRGGTADPISLLERFEASGITSAGGRRKGGAGRSSRGATTEEPEVSSPMHSAPATPLRERTPRYTSGGESDGEEGE
jgi:hypothetical protein